MQISENINVTAQSALPSPVEIKAKVPLKPESLKFILQSRETIENILSGKDERKFMIVGPCSVHKVDEAMEYAKKFKALAEEVSKEIFLVMRVYFEKPRTTVGWKGLINDPDLDGSFNVEKGITVARKFLMDLADMGVASGTEALDPITPQYLGDLISWTAIGARTTESQTHREMASGLSSPVGFKNGTDGGFDIMINALQSCAFPHHFLGISQEGQVSTIATKGNKFGHCILRGGGGRPNYDSVSVATLEQMLNEADLIPHIVVDCSHANSSKNHKLQPLVLKDCLSQIESGNQSLVGFMIESNLQEGNQALGNGKQLKPGVSVTDACVDWQTTEQMIRNASAILKKIKS